MVYNIKDKDNFIHKSEAKEIKRINIVTAQSYDITDCYFI